MRRVLLLGGTGEAHELATRLVGRSDLEVISSLAGRVSAPRMPVGTVREGGFGGVSGLVSYLRTEGIAAVVDATHPFAAAISRNAESACLEAGVPLLELGRRPWVQEVGDRWIETRDLREAAVAVGARGTRMLLTIGRQGVGEFVGLTGVRGLVRSIDAPEQALPAGWELMLARGPFTLEDELALMRSRAIDVVVSKNSGGTATYAKIQAARELGVPVVMVSRPVGRAGAVVYAVDEAVEWLEGLKDA